MYAEIIVKKMYFIVVYFHKDNFLLNILLQSPSLQQLFDAVLSGKAATRVHAQQVLKMLQDAKPVEIYPQETVPVSMPAQTVPVQVPSTPVIKSTNEPMEIGVFRAEDYM